ncbi:hypothetical protein GCM10010508_44110 [Streptomyces naganishii JCM 4654]|uniref:Uncharacterized protein n=2 Tax=Streptomyces naganishii TaxID=285447 RepID=A0A919CWJ7_9ACTN|nr:hypothetical protein GCM10010508_44110 [Streptomyces naganishii JCM 4654]
MALHSATVALRSETAERKAWFPMFQDAPIYHQLVAERGDVPARVRDAATTIRLELEQVMSTGRPPGPFAPAQHQPPQTQGPRHNAALPPGPHPR